MSPRRRTARSRVVLAVVGVVVAGALLWVVTVLISNRTVRPRGPFEADDFTVGHVSALVDRTPFPLPDPLEQGRHVFVQHDPGKADDQGWLVFSAYAPGVTDEACALVWDGTQHFTDPCSGRTYPANGAGLTQYPTEVLDGRLHVDFSP
jgi:hypothetical protein